MQVTGNGSTQSRLHWTLDRADGLLPQPLIFVWSAYAYRLIMFLWALWLAWNLSHWAKWGFAGFRQGGLWKPLGWFKKQEKKRVLPPPLPVPPPRPRVDDKD